MTNVLHSDFLNTLVATEPESEEIAAHEQPDVIEE